MSETIGQQLRREREARFLTLEKASAETRIRVVFLQALEADDYAAMPSAAQGRGFLRNYAEYLGLNLEGLIADIQKNPPQAEVSGPLPQVNLQESEPPIEIFSEDSRSLKERVMDWAARSLPKKKQAAEKMPAIEEAPAPEEEFAPPARAEDAGDANPAPLPLLPADQIFAEIGDQLRARRELISLSVEEVERHTKVRAAFLRALEAGETSKLPSPVQMRGMLSNYASFLDMDTERILLRYAEGLQARRREKYADSPSVQAQTQTRASIPLWRSFIAGDLVFGFLMIAALLGLVIWGVASVMDSQTQQTAQPTAPSISDVLSASQPTQIVGLTFMPVDEGLTTPTPADPQILDVAPTQEQVANISVSLLALERVFVRVSVDGEVAYEGRLSPGETRRFNADEQAQVLTGNAAALRVTYNGADLGLMGSAGEVVSRVYLINGVATPTATISPTPTQTPLVTETPTPTLTPSFTPPVEE